MAVPLFNVGDRVVVRTTPRFPTVNPRTPEYAKGHRATVVATYGRVENPLDHHAAYEPLYTVVFEGREVFGSRASHEVVAEMHEEWLDADS
jgi:hypothetical protein